MQTGLWISCLSCLAFWQQWKPSGFTGQQVAKLSSEVLDFLCVQSSEKNSCICLGGLLRPLWHMQGRMRSSSLGSLAAVQGSSRASGFLLACFIGSYFATHGIYLDLQLHVGLESL